MVLSIVNRLHESARDLGSWLFHNSHSSRKRLLTSPLWLDEIRPTRPHCPENTAEVNLVSIHTRALYNVRWQKTDELPLDAGLLVLPFPNSPATNFSVPLSFALPILLLHEKITIFLEAMWWTKMVIRGFQHFTNNISDIYRGLFLKCSDISQQTSPSGDTIDIVLVWSGWEQTNSRRIFHIFRSFLISLWRVRLFPSPNSHLLGPTMTNNSIPRTQVDQTKYLGMTK